MWVAGDTCGLVHLNCYTLTRTKHTHTHPLTHAHIIHWLASSSAVFKSLLAWHFGLPIVINFHGTLYYQRDSDN